jgi:hypothetical protein
MWFLSLGPFGKRSVCRKNIPDLFSTGQKNGKKTP